MTRFDCRSYSVTVYVHLQVMLVPASMTGASQASP